MTSKSEIAGAAAGATQNRDFIEALMAVCVLAASADDRVQISEIASIGAICASDTDLSEDAARKLLADYTQLLQDDVVAGRIERRRLATGQQDRYAFVLHGHTRTHLDVNPAHRGQMAVAIFQIESAVAFVQDRHVEFQRSVR